MGDAKIDELILSIAEPRWQKVALLISKVTRDERFSIEETLDEFETVAARIEQLVVAGRLLAQGDISQWRFSEVKLLPE